MARSEQRAGGTDIPRVEERVKAQMCLFPFSRVVTEVRVRDAAGLGRSRDGIGGLAPGLEVSAGHFPGGVICQQPPSKARRAPSTLQRGPPPQGHFLGNSVHPRNEAVPERGQAIHLQRCPTLGFPLLAQEEAWPCLTLAGTWGSGRPSSWGARARGVGLGPESWLRPLG